MKNCRDCIYNRNCGDTHFCYMKGCKNECYQENAQGCEDFEPRYKHKEKHAKLQS